MAGHSFFGHPATKTALYVADHSFFGHPATKTVLNMAGRIHIVRIQLLR